jgi:hypothetical protein
MTQKLLLVDYENVQQIDFSRLDGDFNVIVFVGASQKTLPVGLVSKAQKLGSRVTWQQVDGNGGNALDFYIACHLGRVLETTPDVECVVLSKDKGFDPLLRHLHAKGLKCRRINSLLELGPSKPATAKEPNYARVHDSLRKSPRTRPRKRETLKNYIATMLPGATKAEVSRVIDILFATKVISESGGTIAYAF